jgi:Copper type II ascorbate-dependent monooxygenase, C-terminal domain
VPKPTLGTLLTYAGLAAGLFAVGCSSSGGGTPCEGDDCAGQQSPSEASDDDADAGTKKPDTSRNDAGAVKDASGSTSSALATALPCDVKPLVEKYCGSCHGEKPAFGASGSLVTAADFAKAKATNVKGRITATEAKIVMPPVTSDQPSDAERATLLKWLDSGAKGTTDKCVEVKTAPDAGIVRTADGGVFAIPGDEELECYKFTAHNGDFKTPYAVGAARDAYFNFTFKAAWKGTAYGVTVGPVIDNMQAIHHWLLFQDDVPGIPGGAQSSIGAHPAGQLLYGWAPGGEKIDFRETGADVGLELPGDGQTYTMEYHYNSSDGNAKDASGAEICVHHRKTANVAGLSWLGNDQLLVPSTTWSGTCRPLSQEPIHIVAVIPHMHLQGRHMKGTITRKDGKKETLHDEPFDFNYQKLYKKNVTLMPGESIFTECTYAQPMSFGESTNAEMCYLFTMAYPKGALASPDIWGSFAHGGSSCLGQ